MPEDVSFLPAERLRAIAGEAVSRVLPDELGETLPLPVSVDGRLRILIMYYPEVGPPGRRTVHPPTHAIHLDGSTGQVLRLWACAPEELGIVDPGAVVPGAGIRDGMGWEEFAQKRARVLELSADLWRAYAVDQARRDDETTAKAREYRSLLFQITPREVAPFYVQAASGFFRWLEAAAP